MRQPPSHDPVRRALVRAAAALAAAESFQLPGWATQDPTVLPPAIGAQRDQIVLPLYCMGSAVITTPVQPLQRSLAKAWLAHKTPCAPARSFAPSTTSTAVASAPS